MTYALQEILTRHWLFGSLPQRTRQDLAGQFSVKKYTSGQFIFHQHDRAERLYVILDGEISVETMSMDGKITKITHLGKGEIFGEFALIDDGARSASATVVRKATLASLSSSTFGEIMDAQPGFAKRLLRVLVTHIRNSNLQIESLVTLSLLQRTAQLLVQMSHVDGQVIKITQRELGERLFASREKVNVKLKELEQMGWIRTGHGKIEVLMRAKLNQIIDNEI